MKYFWQISNSTAALYGAAVVGLSAVLMHLWQGSLSTEAVARVISALAMLAFHVLALLAIGTRQSSAKQFHWSPLCIQARYCEGQKGQMLSANSVPCTPLL